MHMCLVLREELAVNKRNLNVSLRILEIKGYSKMAKYLGTSYKKCVKNVCLHARISLFEKIRPIPVIK